MTTTATAPRQQGAEWRRMNLLAVIAAERGEWTVGRVKRLYERRLRTHVYRSTIRRDLSLLHQAGHLIRHGDGTPRRYYTHSTEGGDSR